METLLVPTLLAAVLAVVLTPLVGALARGLGIVDRPGGRRVGFAAVTPRLGGLAVFGAFFAVLWLYLPSITPHFRPGQLTAFALAAAALVAVGVIDDKWGVPPALQLLVHIAVAVVLVAVGMGIEEVTNPFGGRIDLHQWQLQVPFSEAGRFIQLPADLITVAWVVLVINAINWLDGLDGLAAGVGGISAVTLALLSLSAAVGQPHVALLAMVLAGSLAGFLIFNFHPAKIFLGTAGSTFLGFTIATLAIISGGKVATAVLVLGFPILDALTVIIRRSATGGVPWRADTKHFHHQLLARGWSVRRAVLFIYILSALFGALALLAGTTSLKLLAFVLLLVLLASILLWLTKTKPARASK